MPFLSAGLVPDETGVEESEKREIDKSSISRATSTAIDTKVDTKAQRRSATFSALQAKKGVETRKSPSKLSATKPAIDRISGQIPFIRILIPKVQLITILIQVDPIAALIVSLSIIAGGLSRAWSLGFKVRAITMFQEAIISRNVESATITPLLLQQLVTEISLQVANYVGLYGHKRYKKKMRKHLTEQLLEAYGSLSYEVRIDDYTKRRYRSV